MWKVLKEDFLIDPLQQKLSTKEMKKVSFQFCDIQWDFLLNFQTLWNSRKMFFFEK